MARTGLFPPVALELSEHSFVKTAPQLAELPLREALEILLELADCRETRCVVLDLEYYFWRHRKNQTTAVG